MPSTGTAGKTGKNHCSPALLYALNIRSLKGPSLTFYGLDSVSKENVGFIRITCFAAQWASALCDTDSLGPGHCSG